MNHKRKFYLFVLFQLVILVLMIGFKYYTVTAGTKILLKTVPVDPRDIFRGDYVVLNYEISDLNLKKIPNDLKDFNNNETVYVRLYKSGKYWEVNYFSLAKPKTNQNDVVIKGRLLYRTSAPPAPRIEPIRPDVPKAGISKIPIPYPIYDGIKVEYGIESYYVPEGKGLPIQRTFSKIDAEVSVDRFGNSAPLKLFMDDKELTFK